MLLKLTYICTHNHGNNWVERAEHKYRLAFARHTGYGGYSTENSKERGARMYEFKTKKGKLSSAETYMRLDDYSVYSRTNLYG